MAAGHRLGVETIPELERERMTLGGAISPEWRPLGGLWGAGRDLRLGRPSDLGTVRRKNLPLAGCASRGAHPRDYARRAWRCQTVITIRPRSSLRTAPRSRWPPSAANVSE